MREHPTGAELLTIARKVLREDLLNFLPRGRRYDALMVANAIAIAARQLEYGEAPERRERRDLATIFGEMAEVGEAEETRVELTRLYRRLCEQIRGGGLDTGTPRHQAARNHLWRVTVQKVRESNPEYLKLEGID